ncbi:MAG TPA: hypothetical protein VFF50_01900 [Candidatus Deferrimicrobiaceae bacterium]|nr:hypothetical protein [Candidatus Deferrimicrobiaceae bacterium]
MDPLKLRLLFVVALSALFAVLLTGCGGDGASMSQPQTSAASIGVTVTAPAATAGIVTSSPAGINCPPTCSAKFPLNTQVELSAAPGDSYFFGGWRGSCSGMSTCSLNVVSAENVTAIFTPASSGTNVVAYVFTPDTFALKSLEFGLLADGELQATGRTFQPLVMTGTVHGLVMDLPGAVGEATSTLQSYAVKANGSLRPTGLPVSVAMNQSVNLISDQTFIYAATDLGLFGFVDESTGLSPLPPIQQTIPPPVPCTAAQENAGECRNTQVLELANASAFLLQTSTGQSGPPLYELSSFVRSEGQLTGEQYFAGNTVSTSIFAPTPDGNFVYALDLASNRVFRYAMGGNGSYATNVLSNGQALKDGFVQLIVSSDGSLLFAPVSDAAESPRIRVFRIDPSSGDLTEVTGSPFLTGEYYLVGATLDPTGHFLLAIHSYCVGSPPCTSPGKLVAMSIDPSTGALSVTSDVEDGQNPFTVTAVSISQ